MASATPDLWLPSQPRGIAALWPPVPNYTAWWQRHMCVNNLPKVVTRQCPGAESNLRPWVTSGLQVRHVTVKTTEPHCNDWEILGEPHSIEMLSCCALCYSCLDFQYLMKTFWGWMTNLTNGELESCVSALGAFATHQSYGTNYNNNNTVHMCTNWCHYNITHDYLL